MEVEDIARLVARAEAGDQEALEDLLQACQPLVYRLTLSILDDQHEAQDASQEIFIKVAGALSNFRGESSFRTWIYAITLNVCRGRFRRRQRRQRLMKALTALLPLEGAESNSPEDRVVKVERDGELMRAVGTLPEEQRTTLILRYYHEMTVLEIAELMGVAERTVYVWLRKAFEQLREDLKAYRD